MEDRKTQGNSDWLKQYNLALTDTVSCDTLSCSRPATNYAHVKCCHAVIIGCVECMHKSYKTVMLLIKEGSKVKCNACGAENSPRGWLSPPKDI